VNSPEGWNSFLPELRQPFFRPKFYSGKKKVSSENLLKGQGKSKRLSTAAATENCLFFPGHLTSGMSKKVKSGSCAPATGEVV